MTEVTIIICTLKGTVTKTDTISTLDVVIPKIVSSFRYGSYIHVVSKLGGLSNKPNLVTTFELNSTRVQHFFFVGWDLRPR
jgi:hypothetical protein